MAEGVLRQALPGVKVESAGLGALVGMPADDKAIAVMRERGIDITPHRARQITRHMCLDAELVLVMEGDQRRRLLELVPEASGRVFRMGEHARRDVPDPYRQPPTAFRDALALIEEGASQWLQRLRQLS